MLHFTGALYNAEQVNDACRNPMDVLFMLCMVSRDGSISKTHDANSLRRRKAQAQTNGHHVGEPRVRAGSDRIERLRLRTHLRDLKHILPFNLNLGRTAVM